MASKKKNAGTMEKIKEPLSPAMIGGTILVISIILFTILAYVGWEDYKSDAASAYVEDEDPRLKELKEEYPDANNRGAEYDDKEKAIIDEGKEKHRMDGKYTVRLGPLELSWIDYFVFALMILIGPYGWWKAGELHRLNKMEEKFPDFLRDLAQFWKGGLSMNVAVETLSEGEYGALDKEVDIMARQLSWGISFNEVLELFVERTRTGLIERSISLVEEANKAGGKITDILMSVSNDAREIKTLQRERDDTMASYVGVVRMAYLIYLIIILIMVNMFLPSIAEESSGETTSLGSVQINEMDTFYISLIFFMSVIVQAVGGGINAGVFGKGYFSVGMKYAVQLSLLGWAIFELVGVKMGLQAGGG